MPNVRMTQYLLRGAAVLGAFTLASCSYGIEALNAKASKIEFDPSLPKRNDAYRSSYLGSIEIGETAFRKIVHDELYMQLYVQNCKTEELYAVAPLEYNGIRVTDFDRLRPLTSEVSGNAHLTARFTAGSLPASNTCFKLDGGGYNLVGISSKPAVVNLSV